MTVAEMRAKIVQLRAECLELANQILKAQEVCQHELGEWQHLPASDCNDPSGGDVWRRCVKCDRGEFIRCPKCKWGTECTLARGGLAKLRCFSCRHEFGLVLGNGG